MTAEEFEDWVIDKAGTKVYFDQKVYDIMMEVAEKLKKAELSSEDVHEDGFRFL